LHQAVRKHFQPVGLQTQNLRLSSLSLYLRQNFVLTVSCCKRPISSGNRVRQLLSRTRADRADIVKSWGGNCSILLNWRNRPYDSITHTQCNQEIKSQVPQVKSSA
jgi:hypothetical protein